MKIIENNKKAYFEYFIEDTLEAGIELIGSEVKSIRNNGISLKESFCRIEKGEVILKNCHIAPYEKSANYLPDARRDRRLLLHKDEISKLAGKVNVKGYSLIATKVYLKDGLVKVELGLAVGKKLHDKRATIKEKDLKREMDRMGKI